MHSIYFDGSCLDNGLPGAKAGWGLLVKDSTGDIVFQANGPVPGKQTNNRGEIMGLSMAIKWLSWNKDKKATIYGDSKYVIDCVTGCSQRKANTDLWEQVEKSIRGVKNQIVFVKHIDREHNKEADKLAKIGSNSLL